MSQLVAVSSPASGREMLERAAKLRRSFFPVRWARPRKPKAVQVYDSPLLIESLALADILDRLAAAAKIADAVAKAASETRRVMMTDVLAAVASHFGVTRRDLLSRRRTRSVSRPRQVAMFLGKDLTERSLPEIGRLLGGKDHTTILHGCRKVASLIAAGDPIAADVDAIRARLLA